MSRHFFATLLLVKNGRTVNQSACVYLSEHRFDNVPSDIRQPEMPPLKLIRQLGVLDTQAMQNGGLQVVHIDGVFRDVIPVVVGLA